MSSTRGSAPAPQSGRRPADSSASAPSAKIIGAPGTKAGARRSNGSVAAKWRWHHQVLGGLQRRLSREHGALLETTAEPLERHCLDQADSAADEFDHELAVSLLAAERNALGEVTAALERIRAGTYGVCELSGKRIPAARLKAIPWTRFTREVAEQLEAPRGRRALSQPSR